MSKHLDPRIVKEVRSKLQALEAPKRFMTAREAVAELEPEIRQAMARGYTLEEIAERIGSDISISHNTLKAYLYAKDAPAKNAAKRPARRRTA